VVPRARDQHFSPCGGEEEAEWEGMSLSRAALGSAAAIAALVAAALPGCGSIADPQGGASDGSSIVPPPPAIDGGGGQDGAGPTVDGGGSVDAGGCTGGDERVLDAASGHCYRYYRALRNWTTARNDCLALGAHLAVVTTQAENDIVTQLTSTNVAWPEIWLAGTDAAVEGTFVWDNAEPMTYTHWATGEPNASNGPDEDCLALRTDVPGMWNDEVCTGGLGYVCEH
jgi:hypothetical protein